ncbi:oligosaccharide flippase family protein [Pontibacter sp. HSC-36F09]|uniref:oligosaccharide flippase family protein n=1 Tax=Pontibacter sp. HSC-36F09 TaxID=2910966 RepID=UPI0020A00106|nr:oligosaccharide flippase family protein [Pontibacter sp. HSC-36F09]MCP2045731.1 O-antigen/teichoic acid export membrane protein [Pontibacter sp. HSC-36F09]
MTVKQDSYKRIIKATSIFGGVQVFNILISIMRTKFIAVLLGPAGMGIAGLLVSTTALIGSMTNFGLATSAVRSVSVAAGDDEKIGVTVSVLRRLVWLSGILGTLVTLSLSSFLSELTFGSKDYTVAFMAISVTLLLAQLSAGQMVILQGMRKLKLLAKADIAGMVLGLFTSIPIYYFLGIKGIVPAILVSSLIALACSWYFSSKIHIPKIAISSLVLKTEGLPMLKMGFMLSLSGLITVAASYILKIFIGRTGGVEQVGFYSAGFAMINTYVGMIFTAMMTDYYPRLAEVSMDNIATKNAINEQAEIAILIIAPILIGFIAFVDWAIILLYTDAFLVINGMLHWATLGMLLKTGSWAVGFIFLAKGATGIFFWSELVANIYMVMLSVLGYYLFGLNGLGMAFLAGYLLLFFQNLLVANFKYQFKFYNAFYKIFFSQFILIILCFISIKIVVTPLSFFIGMAILVLSLLISYRELNARLDLKQELLKIIKKRTS